VIAEDLAKKYINAQLAETEGKKMLDDIKDNAPIAKEFLKEWCKGLVANKLDEATKAIHNVKTISTMVAIATTQALQAAIIAQVINYLMEF
jgi:hypothetical protein